MTDSPLPEMTMEELLNEEKRVSRGQVVNGLILKIRDEEIIVDVGYKTEGVIPRAEFLDISGELTVKPGDRVDVSVERMADSNGRLRLSKRNVDRSRLWQTLEEQYNAGAFLKGRVTRKVNGGYRVDIGVVEAFLPASQVSLHRTADSPEYLEQIYNFKIIKLDRARSNVVLSRRPVLEAEREDVRAKRLSEIQPGDVVEGRVKSLVAYGAFVDLNGLDGLLHVADMDWCHVSKPEDYVKVGDSLKVMVLTADKEKGKVSLGLKQMTKDPWVEADQRYHVGQTVETEVAHFADYGVFLRLADHIEGFCHASEISWSKKLRKPSEVLKLGEKRQAQIIEMDFDKKKIGFSFKRLEKSPWDDAVTRYPIGSSVQGVVSSVTEFGVFLEIGEGLEGLLHQSDISWDKRVKNPQKEFKAGQTLTVKVLGVDPEKKRISLGLKQLEGDPWDTAEEKYKTGAVLTGRISRLTDFGAFVELEKKVEGLIHRTEISSAPPKTMEGALQPGQEVTFKVLSVDTGKRRISLSLKALLKPEPAKEAEGDNPDVIHRKTSTFQKMLKKFFKNAKEEEERYEENDY